MMNSLGLVFGGCFAFASLLEGLSYILGARRSSVQNLSKKCAEVEDAIAKENAKPKKSENHLETLNKQLSERQKELSQSLMWAQLVPTVLSLMLLPYILKYTKGEVAGHLPFNVPWPLTLVVQSGLDSPEATAVSMNCYYFISIAICRSLAKRFYPQIAVPSPF